MHEDIRARIAERLKILNKSESSAAREAGLGASAIRDIGRVKRGKPVSPTINTIIKLSAALEAKPSWIAFGEAVEKVLRPSMTQPKILGDIAAGVWREAEADQAIEENEAIAADPRYPPEAQYLLRAVGTSMNTIIDPGDYILCVDIAKTGLSPRHGDIVVVERGRLSGEREVSAKRFLLKNGKAVFQADSYDPKWQGYELSTDVEEGETVSATALVLRVIKELR
jgi:SOS-response transcriptional repressor LexA